MGIGVKIDIHVDQDVHCVTLEGRLDASTTPIVQKKLEPLLDSVHKLIVDFTDVHYLSSAGMRLLLVLTKHMQAKNGKVAFFGMSEDVFEIIKIAGFERVLKIYPSKSEALKLFK